MLFFVCRNLPALALRLNMDETIMRKALSDSTQNLKVLDPAYKAYLPPVGGATVYFIGDIAKLNDPATEIAVRVHDGQTLSSAQPAAAAADDVSAARQRFHSFSFFLFFPFSVPLPRTNDKRERK